jgi:hypothetical protein
MRAERRVAQEALRFPSNISRGVDGSFADDLRGRGGLPADCRSEALATSHAESISARSY